MSATIDPSDLPLLITLRDLSGLTQRSDSTIRRLVGNGLLPEPVYPGRWARDAVLACLKLRTERPKAETPVGPKFGYWPADSLKTVRAFGEAFPELIRYQQVRFRQVSLPPLERQPSDGRVSNPLVQAESSIKARAGHLFKIDESYVATSSSPMTMETLVRLVMASPATRELKSLKSILTGMNRLWAWSAGLGHPDIRLVTPAEIDCFLDKVLATEWMRIKVKDVARRLWGEAVSRKWIAENPVDGTRRRKHPKSIIQLWSMEDIEQYVAAALELGERGYAAFLLTGIELGQRVSDLFAIGAGEALSDGHFHNFFESKTSKFQTLPLSDQLKIRLREIGFDPASSAFLRDKDDEPLTISSLRNVHSKIRDRVVAQGGQRLVLAKLRHSVVMELALAGANVIQIASLTNHSLRTVYRTLQFYLPKDVRLLLAAQARRGLTYETMPTGLPIHDDLEVYSQVYSGWAAYGEEYGGRFGSMTRLLAATASRAKGEQLIEGAAIEVVPVFRDSFNLAPIGPVQQSGAKAGGFMSVAGESGHTPESIARVGPPGMEKDVCEEEEAYVPEFLQRRSKRSEGLRRRFGAGNRAIEDTSFQDLRLVLKSLSSSSETALSM